MQKNDDLINDILRELDGEKNIPKQPEADVSEMVNDEPESSSDYSEPPIGEQSFEEQENYPEQEQYFQQDMLPQQEQYEMPEIMNQPKKKKKKKKKRSRVPGVLILTTFIFAVSIILSMVIIGFGKDILGIGKSETTKLFVVKEGATTEQIAEQLKEEGIIKSPKCFILFSKLRKSDASYIAGEHFIRANMAYETIITNLTTNEEENKEVVQVTIKEGMTLFDAADILEKNQVCSRDDFIFYFNAGGYGFPFEDRVTSDSNLKFNRMEGYLFPDTYFFYKDMDPEKVCQKIYLNFDQKMTPERYAKMEQLNLTLDQLITLASIVQKEAATKDTMIMVASVFWNRLRNENDKEVFDKLQSDPTKNYANEVIKPNMDVFDKTMIDAYNTYEGTGLPPGAICNPGIEAIDAVLEDHKSEYYYFMANIYTGETEFSATYEEHLAIEAKFKQQMTEYEAEHPEESLGVGDE